MAFCLNAGACGTAVGDTTVTVGNVIAPMSVVITDAATGEPLKNASVRIAGPDKYAIITANELVAGFEMQDGHLALGVRPGSKPAVTGQNYRFSIIVDAEGYMPGMTSVSIVSDTTATFAEIKMINLQSPPQGVSIKRFDFNVPTDGVLETKKVFTVPAGNGVAQSSTLTLEAGIAFLSAGAGAGTSG